MANSLNTKLQNKLIILISTLQDISIKFKMNLLINRFILILNIFFDDINRNLFSRNKTITSRPKISFPIIFI